MKTKNKQLLCYLLSSIILITVTSCGSNSDNKGDSDCKIATTEDRDKDGFTDTADVNPAEPFENGKFANLENVVNSEGVKRILKIAKDRGTTVNLQLGNNPPKLEGVYRSETGGNVVYARNSQEGRTTGAALIETEKKYCMTKGYARIAISDPYGSRFARGILKGDGKHFSIYSLSSFTRSAGCIVYRVVIRSGKVDKKSGDIKNFKTIIAPLGYDETTPGACDRYKGTQHRTEEIYTTRDMKKVKDLDDLEYMCVDEGKAYVPTETWKNKDKESCKCTADVDIECE